MPLTLRRSLTRFLKKLWATYNLVHMLFATKMNIGKPHHVSSPASLHQLDGSAAADAWSLSKDVLHLNHGSFGAVPEVTLEYQAELKAQMESDPVAWFVELPGRVRQERQYLTDWFGAPAETGVLVPNASAGATIIYTSIPRIKGAEIIVTNHGYGAVTMGTIRLAKRWSGKVVTVDIPLAASAQDAADAVAAAFTNRTVLVVLDHVTSATARLLPVQKITEYARERGVLTLVDGWEWGLTRCA